MSRTNIDIDDELVSRVMRLYSLPTKKEAVGLALRMAAGRALTTREAMELEGSGWDADLDELRTSRVANP